MESYHSVSTRSLTKEQYQFCFTEQPDSTTRSVPSLTTRAMTRAIIICRVKMLGKNYFILQLLRLLYKIEYIGAYGLYYYKYLQSMDCSTLRPNFITVVRRFACIATLNIRTCAFTINIMKNFSHFVSITLGIPKHDIQWFMAWIYKYVLLRH